MEAGGRPSSLQGSIRENTVIRHKITPGIFLIISGIYEVGVGGGGPQKLFVGHVSYFAVTSRLWSRGKIRVSSAILIFRIGERGIPNPLFTLISHYLSRIFLASYLQECL